MMGTGNQMNDTTKQLLTLVAGEIDRSGLIQPRATVVVGVSGGLDSVCLLWILHELAQEPQRGYRLIVAHMNHMLRADADKDEAFVQHLAGQLGLTCRTASRDAAAAAAAGGQGLEQAGRMLRYEFLLEVARKHEASCVAVAHHADDNAETVLYRILRGTASTGLAGIPVSRPLLGSPVQLVRPLLTFRRSQIMEHAQSHRLEWREDESNRNLDFRRNFVRHELLDLVRRKLNPRADEALIRLAQHATEVEQHLRQQAQALLQKAIIQPARPGQIAVRTGDMLQASPAVQTQAIKLLMERLGLPMRNVGWETFTDIRSLLADSPPAAKSLPDSFSARREGDLLIIEKPIPASPSPAKLTAELMLPGEVTLPDGYCLIAEILPYDAALVERHLQAARRARPLQGDLPLEHVELLDADRVNGPLRIRGRCDGDGFVPLGSAGRQSVSDFLTNLKVARDQRDEVLCILDGTSLICLWPLRIDNRVKLTRATRRILKLSSCLRPEGCA